MSLSEVEQKFVLHWGEMGTRWGVNRTVAQIHALLYLATEPLNAEQITEVLSVARSNVSNSIKELQSWGLVKVVHVMGDRRDHFESLKDIWDIFLIITEERKKREIDPTLSMLRSVVIEAESDPGLDKEVKKRIQNTLEFMEMTTAWYEQVSRMPRSVLIQLLKTGKRIEALLGKKRKA